MSRFRASLAIAWPAISVYLVLRAISIGVLALLVDRGRQLEPDRLVYWDGSTNSWRGYTSVLDVLVAWDGRWYSKIAEYGYTDLTSGVDADGIPYHFRLAFFPLYPYLARSLTWLPGVDGVVACLVVSFVASVAAAWGIFAVGNHLRGRAFGIILAGLWAVVPVSMSQNGAFTESLFTALAAWALYAVLTREWIVAGGITAVAGLTRPTALALIATVGLAAVVALVSRQDGWRPLAAGVMAPLGYMSYILFAGYRLGSWDGFFQLQRGSWGSYFDFGKSTYGVLASIVVGEEEYNDGIFLFTALVIAAVAGMILLAAMDRDIPWVLVLFAVVMFVGSVGSHAHISSMGRHLLPAFPALIIPAVALSKAPPRTAAVILVGLAILSGWYGGWLPFQSGQCI